MGKQCSSNGLWGMRASGYSSRSSLYRGLFENGGKSPEQGAECEIEDVVRFVITQLGVVPLRDDWEAILAETQDAFQQWRTWGGANPPRP